MEIKHNLSQISLYLLVFFLPKVLTLSRVSELQSDSSSEFLAAAMTNTRNSEIDNTLNSHGKAISDIQAALAALMKQQEQSSKQQEEILKAVRDKAVQSSGSSFGSFSGLDGDSRTSKPFRIVKIDFPKFSGDDVVGWVYRCEHFFSMDDTPDDSKLRCAAVH
ncbi:hypothetical protein HanHA300_Chr05g0175021 [Helianthus annuus]|nr:hypothetical protein HanHA300_Chr05g0175021 [Helianthus annuus]